MFILYYYISEINNRTSTDLISEECLSTTSNASVNSNVTHCEENDEQNVFEEQMLQIQSLLSEHPPLSHNRFVICSPIRWCIYISFRNNFFYILLRCLDQAMVMKQLIIVHLRQIM